MSKSVKLNRPGAKVAAGGVSIARALPDLRTLLDGATDALATVQYPGDLQGDADAEMSAILKQIKEQRRLDRERYRDLYDDDYYLVVVFQAARQKAEFVARAGWTVYDGRFVNGLELARSLGVKVQPIQLELPSHKAKRKFKPEEVLDG